MDILAFQFLPPLGLYEQRAVLVGCVLARSGQNLRDLTLEWVGLNRWLGIGPHPLPSNRTVDLKGFYSLKESIQQASFLCLLPAWWWPW